MTDSSTPASPAPSGPPAPKTDIVHDVVMPVAQAAVGGIVSAAVNHVAAKATTPAPPKTPTSE